MARAMGKKGQNVYVNVPYKHENKIYNAERGKVRGEVVIRIIRKSMMSSGGAPEFRSHEFQAEVQGNSFPFQCQSLTVIFVSLFLLFLFFSNKIYSINRSIPFYFAFFACIQFNSRKRLDLVYCIR